MNKDFSDWLVASDVDGTLNTKARTFPNVNRDAIARFANELNGNFTLASGRGVESIRRHYEKLPVEKRIPAVIINGAGIYDFTKEELIYFSPVNEYGRSFVREVLKKHPSCEAEIVSPDINYFVNERIFAPFMRHDDSLKYEKYKNIDDVPFDKWGKVIIMGPPGVIKKVQKEAAEAENASKITFMLSSVVSFEVLGENTNKGVAVLKLAEMLGIEREHIAAIGDYFNDYEMLKSVGLPACCAQAPEAMHKIARYHACHCNKGAVADLLKHIENNYN